MASRDLTATFLERRASAIKRRNAAESINTPSKNKHRLTAGGSDDLNSLRLMEEGDGIQMTNLGCSSQPRWVEDVDAVKETLTDIQRSMDELQSMHASRLGSVFGKDLNDMESGIERMTRDITDRFRQAERVLKKVGTASLRAGGEEAAIGANVQRSMAKRLQELSVNFRTSQRKYLAEVQAQKNGDMAVDSRFGIDLSTEDQGDFFTTQQVQVVDDLQEAIHSRDQEISKIAQSIEELGAIFKELAVLVIDQGTILDRIDYNMEAVVEHTKTGVTQLEKAEKAQKNARPMKCILCLVSVICILLLLLILKHRRRH